MQSLRDLYQEVILDHNRSPRNCHLLEDANSTTQGFNPLCGDKITLYVKEANGIIEDISFTGTGCAISVASASLMTDYLKGKTVTEANHIFHLFHAMVTEDDHEAEKALGKLSVLAGVHEFPARVKCATLAWQTLRAALEHRNTTVSTE